MSSWNLILWYRVLLKYYNASNGFSVRHNSHKLSRTKIHWIRLLQFYIEFYTNYTDCLYTWSVLDLSKGWFNPHPLWVHSGASNQVNQRSMHKLGTISTKFQSSSSLSYFTLENITFFHAKLGLDVCPRVDNQTSGDTSEESTRPLSQLSTHGYWSEFVVAGCPSKPTNLD